MTAQRLREEPKADQLQPQPMVRLRPGRIGGDYCAPRLGGFRRPPRALERDGETDPGGKKPRLHGESGLVMRDRGFETAEIAKHDADARMSQRMVRLQSNCLAKALERALP